MTQFHNPRRLYRAADDVTYITLHNVNYLFGMNEKCMWCKATFDMTEGFTHEYIESTPGCWDAYTKILEREYRNYSELGDIHRLTVDTYAVQHPGKPGRISTQSVIVHLISMYFVLEKDYTGDHAREQMNRFLQRNPTLKWLEPPDFDGTLTVNDVLTARNDKEHILLVKKWASSVFDKWYSKHKEKIDEYVRVVYSSNK